MTLVDWIAIAIVLLMVGGAALYIIRAKRKGARCIGCPQSSCCSRNKNGGCDSCKKDI